MNAGRILAATALLVGAASAATAQTATQTVTFAVNAINRIAVSGPASLTINSATAGSQPTSASSTGLTWAVTTNQTNQKVTAELTVASGGNMPAGLTLSATMAAPAVGTSDGPLSLSTTPVRNAADVVKVGDKIKAEIISIDDNDRKIGLSVRQMELNANKADLRKFMENQGASSSRSGFGDLLAEKLKEKQEAGKPKDDKPGEPESESKD